MRALRGSTRTWPEGSDVDLKFNADACQGVAMETQGRRRLADVALVVSKCSRDESLLEFAQGLQVEDAAPVHLYHQRFQALLHGEPLILRVHPFRMEIKSDSAVRRAKNAL